MLYYATLEAEDVAETLHRYFNRGWIVRQSARPNEVVIYAGTFAEIFCELLIVHGCDEATIKREEVIRIANLVNRL